ncbi:unnamed protein product [Haemonchus placei]|uniref:Uncharacterized protein n=1 Tax=Haemonchus placei TaxID=6290 RepID=A0A0N4WUM9_HAEPC|nr:unnamed protein product [Haemonchus placei]
MPNPNKPRMLFIVTKFNGNFREPSSCNTVGCTVGPPFLFSEKYFISDRTFMKGIPFQYVSFIVSTRGLALALTKPPSLALYGSEKSALALGLS